MYFRVCIAMALSVAVAAMEWQFKNDHSFESRVQESSKIRSRYPDRIPVIVEKVPTSPIGDINRTKLLVPSYLTVAQFMDVIRGRIEPPPTEPIFLFINEVEPTTSATMGSVYDEHKDEDGFLYVAYSDENTIE